MEPASIAVGWRIAMAIGIAAASMQTPVPAGDDGPAIAANRLVSGIIAYTHWPHAPNPVRLCVTGTSNRTTFLGRDALPTGVAVRATRLAPTAVGTASCDAVFLGQMAAPDRARLLSRAGNEALLTITDDDPDCTAGAMFCLRTTTGGMTFDLNIDSVARSRLRVDPRVLALSRRNGGTQ